MLRHVSTTNRSHQRARITLFGFRKNERYIYIRAFRILCNLEIFYHKKRYNWKNKHITCQLADLSAPAFLNPLLSADGKNLIRPCRNISEPCAGLSSRIPVAWERCLENLRARWECRGGAEGWNIAKVSGHVKERPYWNKNTIWKGMHSNLHTALIKNYTTLHVRQHAIQTTNLKIGTSHKKTKNDRKTFGQTYWCKMRRSTYKFGAINLGDLELNVKNFFSDMVHGFSFFRVWC